MKELGSTKAIIYKISTLIDGGARVTLDLDASSYELLNKLLVMKMKNRELVYVAFVEDNEQ